MKMKLKEVVDAANKNEEIKGLSIDMVRAIGAAYWAGQSDGIRQEREKIEARVEQVPRHRYHKMIAKVLRSLAPQHEMRAVQGLKEEVQELLDWDFDLS